MRLIAINCLTALIYISPGLHTHPTFVLVLEAVSLGYTSQ